MNTALTQTLENLFRSFETGIRSSKAEKPRQYLKKIGLGITDLRIGFNSGQFHHRKPQVVKDAFEQLGVLVKSGMGVRSEDMTAYTVFGRYGLIFPLTDKHNTIVNFFALRFDMASPRAEYMNEQGLYPGYPARNTRRLYLAFDVIDCASLIQSKVLDKREAVLAMRRGEMAAEHLEVIRELRDLEEIIIIMQ